MKKIVVLLLCIGLLFLVACQNKITEPPETSTSTESHNSSLLDGTQKDELSIGRPNIEKIELTSMEKFYLSAFSSGIESDVYLIEFVDEYKYFIATLYYLQDNQWVSQSTFKSDIINGNGFFAIEYSNLFCPKMAFKSGDKSSILVTNSEDFKSQYDQLTWDIDKRNSFILSNKETPIIAYRNSDIDGNIYKANLEDFYALENLIVNENEEYALLTVKVSN